MGNVSNIGNGLNRNSTLRNKLLKEKEKNGAQT